MHREVTPELGKSCSRPRINRLDRRFEVDTPDTVWGGDITYVWTGEGWLPFSLAISYSCNC